MKTLNKLLFIIPFLAGLLVVMLATGLLLATLFDYRPTDSKQLDLNKPTGKIKVDKTSLTLMIWNIGYAGLGKEMDFFYDGGKQVRPSKERSFGYLEKTKTFLFENDTIDFILLQEVDRDSKRSYGYDQARLVSETLPYYNYTFAKNYDVPFVPVPVTNPMGKVFSGLMTLSKYDPLSFKRIQFPGNYSWPKSLFMLDRCFVIQQFMVADNKILTLINTHNSAFDDGTLRQMQMEMLKSFALSEHQKGNYVIIGGDWNQNPPGFDPEMISTGDVGTKNDLGNIPDDFMPFDWQWVYDKKVPTNRKADQLYMHGTTPVTTIDFFLVSPNLSINMIKAINLGFNVSDHNPVIMKVILEQKNFRNPN